MQYAYAIRKCFVSMPLGIYDFSEKSTRGYRREGGKGDVGIGTKGSTLNPLSRFFHSCQGCYGQN